MSLLTQREFSLLAACSDAAVSKAMKAGRLERVADADGNTGIDPTFPLSRLFIESVTAQKIADLAAGGTGKSRGGRPRKLISVAQPTDNADKNADTQTPAPPKPRAERDRPPNQPLERENAWEHLPANSGRVKKKDDEIALKNELLKTKVARDKKAEWRDDRKTHSSALIRSVFGEGAASIEENLGTFADRIADHLEAMGKDGANRTQFAEFVGAEIGKARKSVVKQLKISAEKICAEADDGLD